MARLNLLAAVLAVSVLAVAAVGVFLVMADDDDRGRIGGSAPQLEFMGNMSTEHLSVYLGQEGSSDRVLLDGGGTFAIPSNPVIVVVANNPTSAISVDGDGIVIPQSSGTVKAVVGFQNGQATASAPVLIDSGSAYYAFTPASVPTVNMGLFVNSL